MGGSRYEITRSHTLSLPLSGLSIPLEASLAGILDLE